MPPNKLFKDLLRLAQDVLIRSPKTQQRQARRSPAHPAPVPKRPPAAFDPDATPASDDYPGDYENRPEIVYDPFDDDLPDPGEVVWTWVPYEEDHSQGKDRPVLVIGRDDPWLLALQVTSQDHDPDRRQENAAGRYWVNIGTGAWDSQRRPSEARVNRIIRIDPADVRRIGAVLPRPTFDAVATQVLKHY